MSAKPTTTLHIPLDADEKELLHIMLNAVEYVSDTAENEEVLGSRNAVYLARELLECFCRPCATKEQLDEHYKKMDAFFEKEDQSASDTP